MTRQCRECGSNLPEGAGSCMQCGTPVEPFAIVNGSRPSNIEFLRPAIAGGVFLGVLSSLPYINELNAFFGLWILAGGALATRRLILQRTGETGYGDGAFVGALSGLVGSLVSTILLIPHKILLAATWMEAHRQVEQLLKTVPDSAGPMGDLVLRAISPEISLTTEIYWFFADGIVFSLFAMVGGMLMVRISKRRRMKSGAARP